ncbi:hypothetical protein [Methanoculleus taiwanensis]|uniref:hypothetical protein n=1 Tax=Methanoculleus taiwanensis TaxID=1550565 RepID=UPI000FFE5A27|nr:hypothetical protein [Methanoculleus taiwanensis]
MHICRHHVSPGILLILAASAIICGCITAPQEETVAISSNTTAYSPAMSHTVGIELAVYYTGSAEDSATYHWTADYGEFVIWTPPDYRVTPLGADAVTEDATVYWTYHPGQPGEEPAAVRVAVTIEENETGRTLATAERQIVREGSLYRLEAE